MPQQYDPYGSQNDFSIGGTVKDAATSPLRLGTYATMYTSLPGMWSPGFLKPGQGIWVPGVGKSLASRGVGGTLSHGWDVIKGAYGTRSPGAGGVAAAGARGTAKVGANIFKRVGTLGSIGGGHVGGNLLEVGAGANQLFKTIKAEAISHNLALGATKKGATAAGIKTASKALDNISAGGSLEAVDVYSGIPGRYRKGIMKMPSSAKGLAAKMGKRGLNWARHASKFAKVGLTVGKAVSFVGATMFAWDMAKMVGEPLGRAAVGTLDNALSEYQERFMPEVGGRLELSYLSRSAATERQRAISAISKAYINGRAGLGNEAEYVR